MTGTPEPPAGSDRLVRAQLLRAPLRLWDRAEVHHDQLIRELALIHGARARDLVHAVPARLLELSDELIGRYTAATQAPRDERDTAMAAGDLSIDLTYQLPRSAGAHAAQLSALLVEIDGYCQNGTLLTLPAPPDVVAFSAWYCEELENQLTHGLAPRPWPGELT